ncbi:MAG: hypothetical protein AAFR23_06715, partial [Pseudomonadota bacterium]
MDAFHHEADLLREVADGLHERLKAHADWSIYQRTGMPTERLARDHRFAAWLNTTAALADLDGLKVVPDAGSGASSDEQRDYDHDTRPAVSDSAMIPIAAAPRRALGAQVAEVTVVHKRAALDLAGASANRAARRADAPAGFEPAETDAKQTDPEDNGARPQVADTLTRIRRISPLDEAKLRAAGVFRFYQIAGWTADDVRRIVELIDPERSGVSRVAREAWIEQAAALVARNAAFGPGAGITADARKPVPLSDPQSNPQKLSEDVTASSSSDAPDMPFDRSVPIDARGDLDAQAADAIARRQERSEQLFEMPRASVGVVKRTTPAVAVATEDAPSDPLPSAEIPSIAERPTGLIAALNRLRGRGRDAVVLPPIDDLDALIGLTRAQTQWLEANGLGTSTRLASADPDDVARARDAMPNGSALGRYAVIEQAALLAAGIQTTAFARSQRRATAVLTARPISVAWTPRLTSQIRPVVPYEDRLRPITQAGFGYDVSAPELVGTVVDAGAGILPPPLPTNVPDQPSTLKGASAEAPQPTVAESDERLDARDAVSLEDRFEALKREVAELRSLPTFAMTIADDDRSHGLVATDDTIRPALTEG